MLSATWTVSTARCMATRVAASTTGSSSTSSSRRPILASSTLHPSPQVGRELDPPELHARDLRERAGHQRLREARVVLDQDVPVREQAEQHKLERLALAEDGALDLVEDPRRDPADVRERELGGAHGMR